MKKIKGTQFDDYTGMVIGNLKVKRLKRIVVNPIWECECLTCGRGLVFSSDSLFWNGEFVSRECRYCKKYPTMEEVQEKRYVKHIWYMMKSRCENKENPAYKWYGARGIYVCKEWSADSDAFYEYVSKLDRYYEEGTSLDRIDNDDGYRPGNVRWATAKEQANNRRKRKSGISQKRSSEEHERKRKEQKEKI